MRKKITIVNYHNPKPEVFEEHIRFYARNYSFISIEQVVDCIEKKTYEMLPAKPILITLDDGYARNAFLFDIIERYQIPAIIYAVAGVVGTNRHFWFDKLEHHGKSMQLLKKVSDKERRKRMWRDYGHWDEKEYDRRMALTVKEINKFLELGGMVGSHTLFHPILDRCDEEVGFKECKRSREILEKYTGRPVIHFALPNGNGNEKVLEWIQRARYGSCRTIKPGWVSHKTHVFKLPTFGIADNADKYKAAVQASGVWSLLLSIKRNLGN